jgi:hypothetical protein
VLLMNANRSDRSPDEDLHGRKLVERVVRDAIKRLIETGVEKITEGPESLRSMVAELKVPKEIASYLLLQVEETKNGLYGAVAKEIRSFLLQSNLGEELAKALAHLSLEIRTEIRFVPQPAPDGSTTGVGQPEVRASVQLKSDRPLDAPGSGKSGQR